MDQHLGVAVYPAVELVVCVDRAVQSDLVADDKAWLGLAGDDKVTKVAVVRLDVALAGSKGQTLLEELAERDEDLTLSALLVWRTRVLHTVSSRDSPGRDQ